MLTPPPGFTTPTIWRSCATQLSCLEQSSLDVQISTVTASAPPADALTCKLKTWKYLLVRVFKLPNFKARGELGFWWHINPCIPYKKLMLQGYFLARDHFLRMKSICKATFPRLVCDEMAVIVLVTCVPKKQVEC